MAQSQVVVPFELHGCAAEEPGQVTKLAMRFRGEATVAQVLMVVRGRHYRTRPEEALMMFARKARDDGGVDETIPKMTSTVAELMPAELVVTRESVFG